MVLQELRLALGDTPVVPERARGSAPDEQPRVDRTRSNTARERSDSSVLSRRHQGINSPDAVSNSAEGCSENLRPSVRDSSVVRITAVVRATPEDVNSRSFWHTGNGTCRPPSASGSSGRRQSSHRRQQHGKARQLGDPSSFAGVCQHWLRYGQTSNEAGGNGVPGRWSGSKPRIKYPDTNFAAVAANAVLKRTSERATVELGYSSFNTVCTNPTAQRAKRQ